MDKKDNKAIVRRYIEELNKRNINILNEIVADNVVAPGVVGLEQYRKQIEERIRKFPDYQVTIEKIVDEGDKVILYWKRHGTSVDGEKLDESAVSTYKIANGQIIEVE